MKKILLIFSLLGLLISSYGQLQVPAVASSVQSDPYGPELITNGTFNSDMSSWSGTNWAWQTDGSGGGWTRHTTGSTVSLYQGISVSATVIYKVVFTVGGMTAGTVRPRVGSGGWGTIRSANGTYEENIECAGPIFNFYIGPTTDFDGYIDSISVKEVL